ncbi:hypothetical protein [Kordiimonas marina]|uniref:hypothetical protein n=1 Tax=Kordiimonas marina TaxID=2872312 RepID=UPI001FF18BF0|nr:hypothetical protein [Kordiimonas marina]MCJ9430131.1 hypothetical protein [Kordiimonas marina]
MLRFTGMFTPARVKQWEKQRSKGLLFNIVYMGIILWLIPVYTSANLMEWALGKTPQIYRTNGSDIFIWVAMGLLFGWFMWCRSERGYARWLAENRKNDTPTS